MMNATICFENRNGMLHAFDTTSKQFVFPGGEDRRIEHGELVEFTPEEIHDELVRRGVNHVLVYTGPSATWVTKLTGFVRLVKFAWAAAQAARSTKVWTLVPVDRIADGSDWNDIYGR